MSEQAVSYFPETALSTPSVREALIEERVRKFRQQLVERLPHKDQTHDQIEVIAGKGGNGVSQNIQENLTEKQTSIPCTKRQGCAYGEEGSD